MFSDEILCSPPPFDRKTGGFLSFDMFSCLFFLYYKFSSSRGFVLEPGRKAAARFWVRFCVYTDFGSL